MSGYVLCGNALRALCQGFFVSRLFFSSEFALRMSIEVGSVTTEREHEQKLSVHARGWNVCDGEAMNRRVEGLAE